MFQPNRDALWLHLCLLASWKDKWKIFGRTLIPPRIASLHSPVVRVRNKRPVQSTAGPVRQYLGYLISRSTTHSFARIITLYHGILWWISPISRRDSSTQRHIKATELHSLVSVHESERPASHQPSRLNLE
jgi:hypothetical protein